jgi:hypothetical protein
MKKNFLNSLKKIESAIKIYTLLAIGLLILKLSNIFELSWFVALIPLLAIVFIFMIAIFSIITMLMFLIIGNEIKEVSTNYNRQQKDKEQRTMTLTEYPAI